MDHDAGTVTLPVDALDRDVRELSVMQTARAHFRAACMGDEGFGEHWTFDGPVELEAQPSRRTPYGVWRAADVRATGYADVLEPGPPRTLGDDEAAALRECEAHLVAAGLETDEGRALRDRWARCLAEDGVHASQEPTSMVPDGVHGAPLDEQVRVGLVDVACKDRLDLVQRLGDLEAAEQARYLERARPFHAAVRALEDPVLEQAREYLAEHGITVP